MSRYSKRFNILGTRNHLGWRQSISAHLSGVNQMNSIRFATFTALCFSAATAWAQDDGQYRTWTDSTGKFKIEAAFVKFESGKVHLKPKGTDQSLAVAVGKLSSADQSHIRKLLASQKTGDKPASSTSSSSPASSSKASNMTWQGSWNNRKFGTKGPLVCTAKAKDDKTWDATFTGTGIGKPFKYQVTINTTKKGNQTLLQGTSMLDGDRYQWSGYVEGKTLHGRYRSAKGNNGEFMLQVPRDTK